MTAKEFLNQVKAIKKSISEKEKKLAFLEEMKSSISGTQIGGEHNSTRNTEPAFVRRTDEKLLLEEEIRREKELLEQVSAELKNKIACVDDVRECRILWYRHVKCLTWKEIAEKLGYTERWIFNLYDKAIISFEKNNSV